MAAHKIVDLGVPVRIRSLVLYLGSRNMNPFVFVVLLLAVLMGFVFLVLITSGEMDPAVREANLARAAAKDKIALAEAQIALAEAGTEVDYSSTNEDYVYEPQTIWDSIKFLMLWSIGGFFVLCATIYYWGPDGMESYSAHKLNEISSKLDNLK